MDLKSWAIGYLDGEGSLSISSRPSSSGRKYHYPRLQLQVRLDDEEAINKVIRAIGPFPFINRRQPSRRLWDTKPTIQAVWHSKEQLKAIINFFDCYPLQSKKANEYPFWRESVVLFITPTKDFEERENKISQLYERIKEVRKYKI